MALICYSVEITHQFKCHLERIEANQRLSLVSESILLGP